MTTVVYTNSGTSGADISLNPLNVTIGSDSDRLVVLLLFKDNEATWQSPDLRERCLLNSVLSTSGNVEASDSTVYNNGVTFCYWLEADLPAAGSYNITPGTLPAAEQYNWAVVYLKDVDQLAPFKDTQAAINIPVGDIALSGLDANTSDVSIIGGAARQGSSVVSDAGTGQTAIAENIDILATGNCGSSYKDASTSMSLNFTTDESVALAIVVKDVTGTLPVATTYSIELSEECQSADFAAGIDLIKDNAGTPESASSIVAITLTTTAPSGTATHAVIFEAIFASGQPDPATETLHYTYDAAVGDINGTAIGNVALASVVTPVAATVICPL